MWSQTKRVSITIAATLCLSVIPSACDDVSIFQASCDLPCYEGPSDTYDIGECRTGTPVCAGNEMISCKDQVLPRPEFCDGLDNNCDGKVDELTPDERIGQPCNSTVGECRSGSWQCYEGTVQCFGFRGPSPEICDGIDNDCNGLTDDLGTLGLCYDADPASLLFPPCHAGIIVCAGGSKVCANQSTPNPEICDDIDNDCDGLVDEELGIHTFDVVLIIDRSCSMASVPLSEVTGSIYNYLSRLEGDDAYRFSVIGLPAGENKNYPAVLFDFLPSTEAAIQILNTDLLLGTGYEPSYDALGLIQSGWFNLSWRGGSQRHIVLWTDENGQSYRDEPYSEAQLALDLAASGFKFHAFIREIYRNTFDDIAMMTGGSIFLLSTSSTMASQLAQVLKQTCENP